MLVAKNVYAAFEAIIQHFRPVRSLAFEGISATASVAGSAQLGCGTSVGPGATVAADCVIGDRCRLHPNVHIMAGCRIGDDCEFFPGAVLYPDTIVGSRVLVHANAVLGAYGFGYKTISGRHQRSGQLGWVELGDDVEIGAGVTIDRGTYGATRIGEGSKLDNQVHIGHNCQIGRHNLLCAHVGMAGSCSTGDYVVMAGQAGMADHIHLGNRVVIGGQAGVMQDVPDGQTMFGSPAMPAKRKMQEVAIAARLPELRREMREMQKQLQELQEQLVEQTRNELHDAA
jgi:UDP-3-O-[3-hydroxymyristoyl] glucosamine N-acyltransferase